MGRYYANRSGYHYILNLAPDVRQVCELAGSMAMSEARKIGGPSAEYAMDTRPGLRRMHTRVRTVGPAAANSERKWHALRNSRPRI